MCIDCGCGPTDHHHHHDHAHDHHHPHPEAPPAARTIRIEEDILAKNNRLAGNNRALFDAKGLFVLNLVSSPGSGKTSILERTLRDLQGKMSFAVLEGDQQTDQDAARIAATGVPVHQINTGAGCHLDAHMVGHGIAHFDLDASDILMIENVGNLVCPAAFDLGEDHKVAVLSVTEGEDKPIKYPNMFHAADLLLINKIDLLPYLDFDLEKCKAFARQVKPDIKILEVSCKSGQGMDGWYAWLAEGMNRKKS
ncbi:Hydrogenase nickel incorporation protein HypB [Geoalkalibacter ferrihydriticus]|uniref:Hydrogenase nickel incorporation protein HypB n=1 Tax=Geoalkalibacter ferrihydriticus TaxID=392333 RepID=A0A1G9TZB9_9BACT|nr:hydrogenase nickel incorporation protein HypB [Geoalkalibacter ferrihydriticus]SDM53022.1 Hydrogenase nickel incorporation protein HypB [Geoalkalibacter ferrihydriticus]